MSLTLLDLVRRMPKAERQPEATGAGDECVVRECGLDRAHVR